MHFDGVKYMNWSQFEEGVKERMECGPIPGVAIAVSKYNKVIYQKGFGVQNLQSKEPVRADTVFGIASVTKSFTALAIMQLVEAGKLSVHDPVVNYLPNFNVPGIKPVDAVKIHHLLTHSTGIAPIERREELNQFHEHIDYLARQGHELLGKPGAYFSYSNDMFLLLGAIIENVTGVPYRQYMREQILQPLQLNCSTYSIEQLEQMGNVSTPYLFNEDRQVYEPQPWPTLGNYEVGGGIRSTVLDLIKYGNVYVNQRNSNDELFVSSSQMQKMWHPYIKMEQNSYYGYGFKITPNYHGATLVEHGGGQPGVSSNFGFVPEHQLVVAVLTNVSNAPAREIWIEAVHTALGIPIAKNENGKTYSNLRDEEKHRLVGVYESKEGTCLEIVVIDGEILAKSDGHVYDLRAINNHTLQMKANNKTLQFFLRSQHETWAVLYGMRMLLKRK